MLSVLRKKLLFRAWHRGTREGDLLMGRFAESFLATCDDDAVAQFDLLLSESDPDIYDWITGRLALPDASYRGVLDALMQFYRLAA